jgi:hypothetical protein
MVSMVRMPMTGTSKRMSCFGLATLTTVRRRASVEAGLGVVHFERAHQLSGALDGGVGAFHGLDGHAGLGGHYHGLADVEAGDGAGHARPYSMSLRSSSDGARAVSTPSWARSGSRN